MDTFFFIKLRHEIGTEYESIQVATYDSNHSCYFIAGSDEPFYPSEIVVIKEIPLTEK